MTPDEAELNHFVEWELELDVDDSPTVTFELQVQPWTLRQILVTGGIWLTILAVCAVPWVLLIWWFVR